MAVQLDPLTELLLTIRDAGLPEPATEVPFDPERGWRFDYAWPEFWIALEFEGGQFARRGARRCPVCRQTPQGRHNTAAGYREDCVKYSRASILGWTLVRVTPEMVRPGTALELVRAAFERSTMGAVVLRPTRHGRSVEAGAIVDEITTSEGAK